MKNLIGLNWAVYSYLTSLTHCLERYGEINLKVIGAAAEKVNAAQTYWNGVFKYMSEFMTPFWIALNSFSAVEKEKLLSHPSVESMRDYVELLQFNLQVAEKGLKSSVASMNKYHARQVTEAFSAWLNTIFDGEGEAIDECMARQAKQIEKVVYAYPKAIRDIKPEYGFHFNKDGYVKAAETDRFLLYHVLPTNKKVTVRKQGKPIIIIPPYVLGANILSFLPGEHKSYVHAFANQGIPAYIRIMKDITTTPAVQIMTGEDDAQDTRFLCEQVKARHGREVTLNGFCQGGFIAVVDLLSGELDGLVDALITCVAPIDGTRSKSLIEYIKDSL